MTAVLTEMSPNGRLVIPAATRNALGLSGRERFAVDAVDGSIVLTPVGVVPLDRGFPITPQLVASADRAGAETGQRVSRAAMRTRLASLAT